MKVSKEKHQSKGDILIVDDTPNNLRLLSTMLTDRGYDVRSVINGQMALMGVHSAPPDLILLDINMPLMNGYEVCEKIKSDPTTAHIPIIFISALDEVTDKVKGFAVGGADYITKPFQVQEVLARVENQLAIALLQKNLEQQISAICTLHNQLERETNERKKLEASYQSIFENSIDGLFQVTPEGRYLKANLALANLYGYETPDMLMLSITDVGKQLYVQPTRRAEFLAYMNRYETVSDFESQVYRRDGSTLWISEDVRTVKDERGDSLYYEGSAKDITDRKQTEDELRRERQKTERLLLNILPQRIAERLKVARQTTVADNFDDVTVLFADIVDFTQLSAQTAPTDLIDLLNQIFSAFDQLVEKHSLEKIKTIGDAYMVAGGLPSPMPNHVEAIADLALDMKHEIRRFKQDNGDSFNLRIGISRGPVIAGVIGTKKFSYDLWGDTVNVSSRMESEGIVGEIQVTDKIYEYLKDRYDFEQRGNIFIKGKGMMMTYLLKGKKPIPPPLEPSITDF